MALATFKLHVHWCLSMCRVYDALYKLCPYDICIDLCCLVFVFHELSIILASSPLGGPMRRFVRCRIQRLHDFPVSNAYDGKPTRRASRARAGNISNERKYIYIYMYCRSSIANDNICTVEAGATLGRCHSMACKLNVLYATTLLHFEFVSWQLCNIFRKK